MITTGTPPMERLIEFLSSGGNLSDETSAKQFAEHLSISDRESVKLAQELATAGFGRFVIGRRNHPTRLKWNPGQPDVAVIRDTMNGAREAVMKASKLNAHTTGHPQATLAPPASMTIPQAKEALALSLGVSPENIEIIIRA